MFHWIELFVPVTFSTTPPPPPRYSVVPLGPIWRKRCSSGSCAKVSVLVPRVMVTGLL